jgi:rRNA maturation endonuclease Nob1
MDLTASEGAYRCDACAATFKNPVQVCPQCSDVSVDPDSNTCTACGTRLRDGRTPACPICGNEDVKRVE